MNNFFEKIFGTSNGPIEITLFSVWHILWIVLILGCALAGYFILRKKPQEKKVKALNVLACLVIGFYILDFFIMPFSQGKIDIDKLPFHICTLTGIFVPFVQFNKKFKPIKNTIVCFAIVSSLMYITYPGSALGGVTPWCYKVVQTFVYHGLVFAWGFLSISLNEAEFNFKEIWKEAVGLVLIILWAAFGNYAYVGIPDGHHYDWFFITGSTFPFIPSWLMPFVVFAAVFGMCAIIYLINFVIRKIITKSQNKKLKQGKNSTATEVTKNATTEIVETDKVEINKTETSK